MDEKGQGRRYFTNNKKLSDLTHLKFICILSSEVLRFLFWERREKGEFKVTEWAYTFGLGNFIDLSSSTCQNTNKWTHF